MNGAQVDTDEDGTRIAETDDKVVETIGADDVTTGAGENTEIGEEQILNVKRHPEPATDAQDEVKDDDDSPRKL